MQQTLFGVIARLRDPNPKPEHQVYVLAIEDPEGKRGTYWQIRWMPPNSRTSLIVGHHQSERLASIRKALIEHTVRANPNIRTWDELEAVLGLSMAVGA